MRKALRFGLAGLMTAALLGGTSTAFANDGDVIKEGPCSMQSDWKIKNSPENNGAIVEIEFEVDQNVVGDTWKVTLKYNGQRIFSGNAVTQAPSGSFEIRRNVSKAPGPDTAVGTAKNLSTGETCKGTVTSNF